MGKPRKQTYTMDLFLKNIRDQDIRQDQDVQRLSDQWSNAMMNELISTVLNDGYIPPIILGQEENSQMWIVDGLQRSTVYMKFRFGNYKITTSIEEPIITYRAKVRDSENEVMIDGNGDIVWENREFDIRHKSYSQLPEELKKVFDEYQIETVIHEGYSMTEISKFVRRYNFHKSMNASQRMFTFVDRHARKIREILRKRFFVECTAYTKNERKNGTLERILMESVMCMFHLDNWKKSGQLGEYINENAAEEEFDALENIISRLENIITEQHYSVFNSRDSFLWFTLFYRFTKMNCDDGKFAQFLTYFKEATEDTDMNEFYGIDKNDSTKDKNVIVKKLDKLENMMSEFLGMPKVGIDVSISSEILDFIRENANPDATEEDLKLYDDMLNTFACKVNSESELLESYNKPSMLAIIAYSCIEEIDLDSWLVEYINKNDTYFKDQVENFQYMKYDLEDFNATQRISEI